MDTSSNYGLNSGPREIRRSNVHTFGHWVKSELCVISNIVSYIGFHLHLLEGIRPVNEVEVQIIQP